MCAKDLIVHQESGQKEEMQPSINWGKQDWHRGGSVFYSTLLLISWSVQFQIRGGEIIVEKSHSGDMFAGNRTGGVIIEMTNLES